MWALNWYREEVVGGGGETIIRRVAPFYSVAYVKPEIRSIKYIKQRTLNVKYIEPKTLCTSYVKPKTYKVKYIKKIIKVSYD